MHNTPNIDTVPLNYEETLRESRVDSIAPPAPESHSEQRSETHTALSIARTLQQLREQRLSGFEEAR